MDKDQQRANLHSENAMLRSRLVDAERERDAAVARADTTGADLLSICDGARNALGPDYQGPEAHWIPRTCESIRRIRTERDAAVAQTEKAEARLAASAREGLNEIWKKAGGDALEAAHAEAAVLRYCIDHSNEPEHMDGMCDCFDDPSPAVARYLVAMEVARAVVEMLDEECPVCLALEAYGKISHQAGCALECFRSLEPGEKA